jgi:hypothetical protein
LSDVLILPDEIRREAERWLDDIEAALVRLEASGAALAAPDAASLSAAIEDVRTNTSFARRMFAGGIPLGTMADDRWVPIAKPSRALAVAVHSLGDNFARTPFDLLARGKNLLTVEAYKPFSLQVAYVLASIFTNLTRAVWEDYPEYAPSDWKLS